MQVINDHSLAFAQLGTKITLTTPLNSWNLQSTKTPWKHLKIPKILKEKRVLQETHYMQDQKLPKDLENPNLRGGIHCLPRGPLTKKKNLKKSMIPAEIP